MLWLPVLSDVFGGLRPWDVLDLTPRELEQLYIYLEKMNEEPKK